MREENGFTLIELLMTITIIGILVNMALPSLNLARGRAIDAKVTSQLVGIRAQSENYYDDTDTYTDMCTADVKIVELLATARAAVADTSTDGGLGDGECNSDPNEWAVWVNLHSKPNAYCIDRTGSAREVAIQDSSAVDLTACP
jgi:prepilin-type N-terminal cleavage/methylation domain-containing protein